MPAESLMALGAVIYRYLINTRGILPEKVRSKCAGSGVRCHDAVLDDLFQMLNQLLPQTMGRHLNVGPAIDSMKLL